MQLTLERNAGIQIESYTAHSIRINEQDYTQSMILTPDKIFSTIAAIAINEITETDCNTILSLQPEIVVMGSGNQLQFLDDKFKHFFYQHHIGLEVMDTPAACRTFNILCNEGRKVIALLIIA